MKTTRLRVPFQGEGAGVGELTWGQKGLWTAMQQTRTSLPITGVDPLPPGTTIELVVAAYRFVLSRHQSLRTRLRFAPDGRPQQVVSRSGEAVLDIVDCDEPDADPAAVAGQISERYQRMVFDYEREWPIRMAVVRRHGVLTHAVVGYCHLALDAFGLAALVADLATMDRDTGGPTREVTGIQPLELARRQGLPGMQRHCETSLRYWERLLRSIPARRFRRSYQPCRPRYREIGYRSPAALLAAEAVCARTRTDTGPVLLAAAAVAFGRLTGDGTAVLQIMVNNRFRPGFAESVTPLTQSGLCVLDTADCRFDDVVAGAVQASTRAAKHAYYDPHRNDALLEEVSRDRGEQVDLGVFFNDRRTETRQPRSDRPPTPGEVLAALPRSELRWERELELFDHTLFIHVNPVPDTVDWMICADTRYVPPADLEGLVRGIEAVLVEAATDPHATTRIPAGPAAPALPTTSSPAAGVAPAAG